LSTPCGGTGHIQLFLLCKEELFSANYLLH
jgi:hypothetical protein